MNRFKYKRTAVTKSEFDLTKLKAVETEVRKLRWQSVSRKTLR